MSNFESASPEVTSATDREATAETLLSRCEQEVFPHIQKALENPQRVTPEVRGRLERIARKAAGVAKHLALLGTALYVIGHAEYEATHEKVAESMAPDGSTVYAHPDVETTKYINYLSGTTTLSVEDRLPILKEKMRETAAENNIALPEGFDSYGIAEIRAMYTRDINCLGDVMLPTSERLAPTQTDGQAMDVIFDAVGYPLHEQSWGTEDDTPEVKRRMYNLLWQVEKESGAPYVRPAEYGVSGAIINTYAKGTNHYNPLSNTMHIDLSWDVTFFAEAAHGKQFEDSHIRSYAKALESGERIVYRALKMGLPLVDSQREEYSLPGSLEYEAHSEIEPAFLKRREAALEPPRAPDSATRPIL